MIDTLSIRTALAALPSDHDASGEHRPTVDEIFTPEQHANALDPNTPIVVGARGTGKSFWAGVLGQDDTKAVPIVAYPNLRLDRVIVRAGYSGLQGDDTISPKVIDARVPPGTEKERAFDLWQIVIIRAAISALNPAQEPQSVRELMARYADPEDFAREFSRIDAELAKSGKLLLITFDALDTLSLEWARSSRLVDALFEAVWALRSRKAVRAKVFIRPEQLYDESLRFVELPKLRSGRVELDWNQVDLYGLLFWRMFVVPEERATESFRGLVEAAGSGIPANAKVTRHRWPLLTDRTAQKPVMDRLAGLYMGRGNKKGGTYDWPYRHLSDSAGKVTPRSFIKLFVEAAKYGQAPASQVISAEGIRHGLREASKVRVDQLGVEYKWVKRALAPLAGVVVPCEPKAIFERWRESNTIQQIFEAANDEHQGFLPPFPQGAKGNKPELLAAAMQRIGLLSYRDDGRIDIPDLFRVAALMLKKGGTPPKQRR
jgi:hypothetical protein